MNPKLIESLRELSRDTAILLRIRGGCMAPIFADGTSVTVRARRFYLPGDVLVFRTGAGDLAAHRLLGWRRAALMTKGDHCPIHDAPVSSHAIVGAVDVRVPLQHRLRAIGHFAAILVRRLLR
jgi:hypothetical protein